jgi:hypothetical protein
LHHIDDLPYDPHTYFPHVYGHFRKKQADVKVRPLLPDPKKGDLAMIDIDQAEDIEKAALDYMPSLKDDFGFSEQEIQDSAKTDKRQFYKFKGGEEAGL